MEFTYTVRSGQEPQNGRLTPKYTGRYDEGWTPTGIGGAAAWVYYGWFVVRFQYSKVMDGDRPIFPPMLVHVVYEGAERSDELAKQALRHALNALRNRIIEAGIYLD